MSTTEETLSNLLKEDRRFEPPADRPAPEGARRHDGARALRQQPGRRSSGDVLRLW